MKMSFKKVVSLIVVACMLCTASLLFAACELESTEAEAGNNANNNVADNASDNTSDKTNKLGDYSVEIKSCRLAEDYLGDPIVIVKYVFTNNDDNDPAAFYIALEDHVYQNGVGLNECYVADDSANYSSDNQTKEIKKGASIEVEVAYKLNDTTSDIEVEVSEWISFSSKKVTKTFKIAS